MQLRESGLTWQTVGDEIVVLDLDGSVYLKLNGSARLLWDRLGAPTDEASLAAELVERYGVDADRAAADTAAFVAELRRRSLLDE
ncbi:MAG: PqqD family protein [Ilumatobacter sp.]|nr:PqqD family protein [Ilumatobacter sp.]